MTRVALPIETKSRELDGKLWLSLHLLNKGYEVVLGRRSAIVQWIDHLQPDVYVAVSAGGTPSKRDFLSQLQSEGVDVMVLDVEGGIFRSDEDYRVRLSTEILEHVDTYLAWGKRAGEIVCEYAPFEWQDVEVTGEMKFDLLHERYRSYYQQEANMLTDRVGDYILVTTNFGLVNHFDNELHRQLITRDDILRLKKPEDDLRFEDTQQEIFEGFRQAIPKIAAKFDDHTIVVRPHPSEDGDTYREITESIENAQLEHSGSPYTWILGANAVIHNNSTIGVESVLLDQPTFAYCPVEDPEYELILPNKVSRKVTSYDELETGISEAIEVESPSHELSGNQHDLLESYFRNTDANGAKRVTAVIDGVEQNDTWNNGNLDVSAKKRLKRTLKRFGLHHPYHALLRLLTDRTQEGYNAQKFPGIERTEIRNQIAAMKRLDDRFSDLEVTVERSKVANDCYWLASN